MKKPKILVVGSFVMDLIVSSQIIPSSGETVLGTDFTTAPGGKGANQAIQAAKLGADVTMVGRVGNDDFGRKLVASANEAGVNTEHVGIDEEHSSAIGNIQLEVSENAKSKNRIIVVSGSNMQIKPEDVAFLEETIDEYDMVMLQHEIPMQINEIVAGYAYKKSVPVMLNPAPSAPIGDELLKKLTYISPNEHEVADITGVAIKDGDLNAVKEAAKVFHSRGVGNVVVTLGSNGAAVSNGVQTWSAPCIDVVEVVDPTAAGDSFVGGFCVAQCMGFDFEQSLTFANYVATITVSRMGAQPSLPSFDEVKALIEKVGEHKLDLSSFEQIVSSGAMSRMKQSAKEAFNHFVEVEKREVMDCLNAMDINDYIAAAELIWAAQSAGNRVHITGIGKPSHIANYMASLLSSTGTPTYFLHGTEAVHGSCGQTVSGDVIIAISNSGETAELKATILAAKNNGCKIIGVSGNAESWLAKNSEAHLLAAITEEGGPLNRAPRSSILAEMLVLQALSVILQAQRDVSPQQYVKWHPGGALGTIRDNEK